jgi:large subunit ribosomal protein L35
MKAKSNSRAKKCIFISGTGKLLRRHGCKNHFLDKKRASRKRKLNTTASIAKCDLHRFKKILNI